MIYEVIITKTLYVEADNEEEAEDMVFDRLETFNVEERISKIVPVKKGGTEE